MSEPAASLLLLNLRLLDPVAGIDRECALGLRKGVIDHIGAPASAELYDRCIDARGLWLMPAAVDLAARFREPGQSHKTRFAQEARTALATGIGTVTLPPDTLPPLDSPAMVDRLRGIAARCPGPRVRVLGAMTVGLKGEALAEMSALKRAGCVGFSQAHAPLKNARVARRALEYARGLDLPLHIAAQDHALANSGCAHEGPVATRLGLPSIPAAAEVAAMQMWLSLVEDTGGRVHFCRLSTARGAELLTAAQAQGLAVTADVAAHQLFMTDDDVDGFNAMAHVIPPLRSRADRQALRETLQRGNISAICSDHQPHEADAKINPFPMTAPGISALETLLPLTLQLVHDGVLTPLQAAARLSAGPAAILGETPIRIEAGRSADLLLIDPDRHWTLDPAVMLSGGRNTPFAGQRFRGAVLALLQATAVDYGRIVR